MKLTKSDAQCLELLVEDEIESIEAESMIDEEYLSELKAILIKLKAMEE